MTMWRLTKRCNLLCKHCSHHLNRDKIQTSKLVEVAHKIAASNTMIVNITGGEMLMVPNIKDLIMILKNAGKIIMLNTNGYNLLEYADFLIENEVDYVAVSFDSHEAQTHDHIRGKIGSFDRAMAGIKYILENRKDKKPYILVRGVVMKQNYTGLKEYVDFFSQYADEVKLQPVHDYEGYDEAYDKDVLFELEKKELESDFNNYMNELQKAHPEFKSQYYNTFSKFLFHKEDLESDALNYCLPVWFILLLVLEDGSCNSCTQNLGNIFSEKTLDEIWVDKKRLHFLTALSHYGKCKIPCLLTCTGAGENWQGKIIRNSLMMKNLNIDYRSEFESMPNFTGQQIEEAFS